MPSTRNLLTFLILFLATTAHSVADETDRLGKYEQRLRKQSETLRKQGEELRRLRTGTSSQNGGAIDRAVERYLDAQNARGEGFRLSAGYDQSFFIEGGKDRSFRLNIGGWNRFRFQGFEKNTGLTSTFDDDAVLEFSGHVWRHHEFKLSAELDAAVSLRDAWYNMHFWDEAQFRVGQFRMPFGYNVQIEETDRNFGTPAMVEQLAPGFDLGAMVHGTVLDGHLDYALGVFNGGSLAQDSGRNNTDVNSDKEIAGRLVLHPFASNDNRYLKHLQAGFSFTWGVVEDASSVATPVVLFLGTDTANFFSAGVVDNDKTRYRLGAHLAWRGGPASFSFEWSRADYGLVGSPVLAFPTRVLTKDDDLEVNGFNVEGTWVLTGEEKGWDRVVPDRFFDPYEGGWGAWELAFRYGYLNLQNNDYLRSHGAQAAAGVGRASEYTFGLNWYMNPNVVVYLNYIHSVFSQDITLVGHQTRDPDQVSILIQIRF